ncbi:hypothetical protein MT325_M741L [Paramecium bursaria chlorella virus MT325]|uniref:Uncharacterized protein M741L n=1 Tax=Paramecium bursaria Chlorella virus MT325 TaxID=346932 RepID=A7IVC1_PBCVM|nr:hypothetical protein MT325_M741L [Paramecium bursaria chlorella virus MT325]
MTPKLLTSLMGAFTGPAMQKFASKVTSRAVVAPVIYALLCMAAFAVVYALIGYKELFEVTEENKDKNWENSVVASVMLQSNAMGDVTAKNSLARWLMTAQVMCGWAWFMVITAIVL